jgi:hypothetical protein
MEATCSRRQSRQEAWVEAMRWNRAISIKQLRGNPCVSLSPPPEILARSSQTQDTPSAELSHAQDLQQLLRATHSSLNYHMPCIRKGRSLRILDLALLSAIDDLEVHYLLPQEGVPTGQGPQRDHGGANSHSRENTHIGAWSTPPLPMPSAPSSPRPPRPSD